MQQAYRHAATKGKREIMDAASRKMVGLD